MKRAVVAVSIGIIMLFSFGVVFQPAFVFAQTGTQSEEAQIAELKAIIAQLIVLVTELQRQVFLVTQQPFVSMPNAPACGQVEVAWEKVPGATGYALYRNGAQVYEGKEVKFSDTKLIPGTTYTYTVRAKNAGGLGAVSETKTITTASVCPPEVPFVWAQPGVCGGTVQVTWSRVMGTALYEVYRGNTRVFGGNNTSFVDRGLSTGRDYTYTVRAGNSGGFGAFSAEVKAKSSAVCPLRAPEELEVGAPFLEDATLQEGILTITIKNSPSGVTVESGKNGKAVLNFRVKSRFSPMTVESVQVRFSDRVWLFLQEVQIREGSRVAASVRAEQQNFADLGNGTYLASFPGLNIHLNKDQEKTVSVFVVARDNLALAQPREIQVSIPENSARATDQLNISHAGPGAQQAETFMKSFFVKRETINP